VAIAKQTVHLNHSNSPLVAFCSLFIMLTVFFDESVQLILESVWTAGGHFVCKLFDLFTPFSVGLVYLMYRAFNRISIFKPVTSRPANSERLDLCFLLLFLIFIKHYLQLPSCFKVYLGTVIWDRK
jgi:FtsJ-like methyltransferase